MRKNGFSLPEVILISGVASVAGVLLAYILVQNSGLFISQTSKISQGVSVNDAVAQMRELIQSSSAVVSTNAIGSPTYTTSSDTLVVTLPAIDSLGNVISNVYDYGVIAKNSQNPKILRKIIFKDPLSSRINANQILTTNLTNITFVYFDDSGNTVSPQAATKINFTINLDEKAGYSNQGSSASGQINLRNN